MGFLVQNRFSLHKTKIGFNLFATVRVDGCNVAAKIISNDLPKGAGDSLQMSPSTLLCCLCCLSCFVPFDYFCFDFMFSVMLCGSF